MNPHRISWIIEFKLKEPTIRRNLAGDTTKLEGEELSRIVFEECCCSSGGAKKSTGSIPEGIV
jgi:hypothetical protein